MSVVIPAYNYARFLPLAVESARAQDYPEFEVIVVDDGSKDNTRELMAAYGPPVRYVYQENAGLSAARNTGIREARFDFVAFLDADDEFLPGLLRAAMTEFRRLPGEFALVACDDAFIDADGGPIAMHKHVPEVPREIRVEEILLRTRFSPSGAVVRKAVFAEVGDFDTSLKSTEDRDMWIRIAARRRVYHHARVLVRIRKHGSNMSNNADRMKSNMARVMQKSWNHGAVPRWRICFWLQVFSFWRFQTALIYNGIRRPLPAYRDLLLSLLYWPWYLRPGRLGYPVLFRARQLARFTLNVLTGRVKS